jgi:hypothetical protein
VHVPLQLTPPPCCLPCHQLLQVKPFEIHFVWGGKGWQGKRQRMREALMYHDAPSYYRQGYFLPVELDYLQVGAARSWQGETVGMRGGGGRAVKGVGAVLETVWRLWLWRQGTAGHSTGTAARHGSAQHGSARQPASGQHALYTASCAAPPCKGSVLSPCPSVYTLDPLLPQHEDCPAMPCHGRLLPTPSPHLGCLPYLCASVVTPSPAALRPQEPPEYNKMKVTEDMVSFHLASMEHQLAQLYHAFALALALDRALILPPLR